MLIGSTVALGATFYRRLPVWPIAASIASYPLFAFIAGHWASVLLYALDAAIANPWIWLQFGSGTSSLISGPLWMLISIVMMIVGGFRKLPAQLDVAALGLAATATVGRLGCFLVHDHPGIATDFFLGVRGICGVDQASSSGACHDLGLYEMLGWGTLFITAGTMFLRKVRPSVAAATVLIGYGLLRLAIDPLGVPLGPSFSQVIVPIALFLGSGLVLAAGFVIPQVWPDKTIEG